MALSSSNELLLVPLFSLNFLLFVGVLFVVLPVEPDQRKMQGVRAQPLRATLPACTHL